MIRHDYEAGFSGSQKVGLDDKTAESPYDLSLSRRKLLSVATAVDPAIYLFDEPMSLDWEGRRKLTAIFISWLIRVPSCDHHPQHGLGRRQRVGVCYGTREVLASPAVHGNCSPNPRTCPASGITTADYEHLESLGDSQTYLSVNDCARKIEMYEKITSAGFSRLKD